MLRRREGKEGNEAENRFSICSLSRKGRREGGDEKEKTAVKKRRGGGGPPLPADGGRRKTNKNKRRRRGSQSSQKALFSSSSFPFSSLLPPSHRKTKLDFSLLVPSPCPLRSLDPFPAGRRGPSISLSSSFFTGLAEVGGYPRLPAPPSPRPIERIPRCLPPRPSSFS